MSRLQLARQRENLVCRHSTTLQARTLALQSVGETTMNLLKFSTAILILILCGLAVLAQTTAFSYQGRLSEAGSPVTGFVFC